MAATDFIVAIELGSSKITGIAGKKHADGRYKCWPSPAKTLRILSVRE